MSETKRRGAPVTVAADLEKLSRIESRVLWLAASIVHHANRVRPNRSGVKVGGRQASSASMASIMTALWFAHLGAEDRVSVKPHASPVLHAISYLLGNLDRKYLTELRAYGELQSYPSRTKNPGEEGGIGADVVCLTSPDLVFRALQARQGLVPGDHRHLDEIFPPDRALPIVSVVDGHPHTLSFLGAVRATPIACLGVTEFGQSGDPEALYEHHGMDPETIVGAALDVIG